MKDLCCVLLKEIPTALVALFHDAKLKRNGQAGGLGTEEKAPIPSDCTFMSDVFTKVYLIYSEGYDS